MIYLLVLLVPAIAMVIFVHYCEKTQNKLDFPRSNGIMNIDSKRRSKNRMTLVTLLVTTLITGLIAGFVLGDKYGR